MMVAMALVVKDRLYYREIEKNVPVNISLDYLRNIEMSGIGKRIRITWHNDYAKFSFDDARVMGTNELQQSGSRKTIAVPMGEITVIDGQNQIAVLLTPVSQADARVYFDSNDRVSVGRTEKKARDGSENTVVVKLPFVSSKHMEIISQNGKLFVRDNGSLNGTFVNGEKVVQKEIRPGDVISILTFRMVYDGNCLSFFNTENALLVRHSRKEPEQVRKYEKKETVIFERSVRLKDSIETETVVIPNPPVIGEKPKIDYLSTFLPAFITVSIGIVMFFTMGNATSLIYSLPMSLSGVIMSVFNYRKQTKEYDLNCSKAVDDFKSKLAEAELKLKRFNTNQLTVMNTENPEISNLINAAEKRSSVLWNRQINDNDFLTVRVGTGQATTMAEIKLDIPAGSMETDYAKECCVIKEKYSIIDNAPVCYDIRNNHLTGIVGSVTDNTKFIRNLIVQLAGTHCYTDLKVVYLDSNPEMTWVSKLPHANGLTAVTQKEVDEVLENVLPILKEREKAILAKNTYGKAPKYLPHILFVLADPSLLSKNYDTQHYIIEGEQLGISVVMSVEEMAHLPINCNTIIRLGKNAGELFCQQNISHVVSFNIEKIADSDAVRFVNALENVRVRENTKTDVTKSLPENCSFYDMLGIKSIKELDIKKRWQENDVCKTLKAPIGVGINGVVELDISGSDSADGPHGLVAGMTGSGKSETIVSYLLALTTLYSPLDLSLVIIDFKGGALCNKFRGIPHLVGKITNLSGKEIERSLKILDAELKHRQQMLDAASNMVATHDIDNVDKYTRLFKTGRVKVPMPHLVIVVDEFAELKAQHPEFLKKLVSAARIGRSLGIHLILATQKPAGQVSDQIWSNSKFRICLKVQTEQDSKEVIKTDEAAKIKEAGRAFLMVGNNERFELLQSGYSGVADLSAAGPDRLSQFNVTVNHIAEYCVRENIQKMPDLFIEALPEQISIPSNVAKGDVAGSVDIGIYDDPANKTQNTHAISLCNSNLLIIGSAQMGKTNLLQTIICSLAKAYTPKDVAIYVLDFASQLLCKYAELNHVGGVVTSMDDEKLKHLMQLLYSEFEIRKEKFAKAGVSSLAAYRNLGRTDVPHIVVIIDNFTALKELYFQEDAELIRLCRDGLSVGITIVAANSQTKGLSYKYLSYFDARIALYNNDSAEYGNLFDHCRETVEKIPGRCLILHNNSLLDCQTFLAFDGNLNSEIAAFNAKVHAKYGEQRAAAIPELPEKFSTADLVNWCAEIYQTPYSIAMGLDYETVSPVVRNVRKAGCLSLLGGNPEMQSAYLSGIIHQMDTGYPGNTKIWILDSIDRPLQPLEALANVVKYNINAGAAPEIIAELEQKVKSRMAMLEFGDMDSITDADLLVLVINNPTVAEVMNANKAALLSYSNLISKYKDMGICVFISNVPNASFISSEFYKKSAENKQFLWFDNLPKLKLVTVPYGESKKFSKKLEAGDVYLFNDTECTKMKTPLE